MVRALLKAGYRCFFGSGRPGFKGSSANVGTLNDTYLNEFFQSDHRLLELQRSLQRRGLAAINIENLTNLYRHWINAANDQDRHNFRSDLVKHLLPLPNIVDEHAPDGDESKAKVIFRSPGDLPKFSFDPRGATELGRALRMLRNDMNTFSVDRAYSFIGPLADLHDALVSYALSELRREGFELLSVPDILPASSIEACGFSTSGERTMVYRLRRVRVNETGNANEKFELRHDPLCLSGTSEMALASYLTGRSLPAPQLPLQLCAASRCFRHEVSTQEDRLYRVHEFNKVEMYVTTRGERAESERAHERIVAIERKLFEALGLHLRVLDMPSHELGASAARKYDVEAWLPGQKRWGELSSASNCTDYQAARLDITYTDTATEGSVQTRRLAHTLNGTACAIPRLLVAVLETHQNRDASINVPAVLLPFMREPRTQLRASQMQPMRLMPISNVPKSVAQLIETAELKHSARRKVHTLQSPLDDKHDEAPHSSESEDNETIKRLLRIAQRKRSQPADGNSQAGKLE